MILVFLDEVPESQLSVCDLREVTHFLCLIMLSYKIGVHDTPRKEPAYVRCCMSPFQKVHRKTKLKVRVFLVQNNY